MVFAIAHTAVIHDTIMRLVEKRYASTFSNQKPDLQKKIKIPKNKILPVFLRF